MLAVAVVASAIGGAIAVSPTPSGAAGPIVFNGSPGTGPPPATLGPYTMTPFPTDARPFFTNVTSVPSPNGGAVTFGAPLSHRGVPGNGWDNWSNGYTGDVYCSTASCTGGTPGPGEETVTMTLPANTVAFYFYAEADVDGTFQFTATAQDGTTSGATSVTTPNGAKYFGFYGTPTDPLVSVTVTTNITELGLAVGEFGIATQAPPPTTTTTAPASVVVVTPKFTG